MLCQGCGIATATHSGLCTHCGASLGTRCTTCGEINPRPAQFCGSCGQRLPIQPADQNDIAKSTIESDLTQTVTGEQTERRQLTVLFCDLVGSTSLSESLDPEDLVRILRSFQEMCSEKIIRYEGHVAQLLGDGIVMYFGHPVAHEDDAQRAVRTALAIQRGTIELSQALQQEGGPELRVRMGIHTGEVIVGRKQMAVGETPNLATRVQDFADPDTIVMTAATHRLVKPYFACKDFGLRHLKGLERPVQIYLVEGETEAHTRMQAEATVGMTPLVGREQETNLLQQLWIRARAGKLETVLIRGEPGIGKSRLIEALKRNLADEEYYLIECYCLAYEQHTPFAPISHLLRRIFDFKTADSPRTRLAKLSSALESLGLNLEQSVPLLAPLVSLMPDVGYVPLDVTPNLARQRILEMLTKVLLGPSNTSQTVFVIEDLHWMDPCSLDLIELIMNLKNTPHLLMVLTCRPEFEARWPGQQGMHVLNLPRLNQEETVSLATHVAHDRTLPPEVLREIVARTDGVPLFVEELTKTLLESGFLKSANGSYELQGTLPSGAIPTTVRGSLMARLDRLGSAKAMAQLGSTIGRDFRHDVLFAVAKMGERELERDLSRLIESDLISRAGVPPKATYTFRHALVQEAAYRSLLKSMRALYHNQIADVLFEHFPEIAENQPEVLAQHYSAAGSARQAMVYWEKAGTHAMERSATKEASQHFMAALELLPQLPDDQSRLSQELGLRVQLGVSITASSGYGVPQVGEAYQRARELCGLLGNTAELYPVLIGLCIFYLARDDLKSCKELAEQCLRLGQETQRAEYLIPGYYALGYSLSYLGDLKRSTSLLEKGVQEYRYRDGKRFTYATPQDPGVACLCLLAINQWMEGDPRGRQSKQEAIDLAEELRRPFDIAYAHCYAAMFHNLHGEFSTAISHAEDTIKISGRHGFIPWLRWGTLQFAIAKGRSGGGSETIELLTSTLAAWRAAGAEIAMSYFLGGLAQVYGSAGRLQEAFDTVNMALEHAKGHGEHWYEPVLYRMRGEYLARREGQITGTAEADLTSWRRNCSPTQQGAKFLELQGAVTLHDLCLSRGRPEPSGTILKQAYEKFESGNNWESPELREARALLAKTPSEP